MKRNVITIFEQQSKDRLSFCVLFSRALHFLPQCTAAYARRRVYVALLIGGKGQYPAQRNLDVLEGYQSSSSGKKYGLTTWYGIWM